LPVRKLHLKSQENGPSEIMKSSTTSRGAVIVRTGVTSDWPSLFQLHYVNAWVAFLVFVSVS